jgi:hypothetical protein
LQIRRELHELNYALTPWTMTRRCDYTTEFCGQADPDATSPSMTEEHDRSAIAAAPVASAPRGTPIMTLAQQLVATSLGPKDPPRALEAVLPWKRTPLNTA